MASVLYQPPVMISISARLQKLYHTFNLYDVTSSIAVTVAKAFKSLICMTSCQTYNLYDVMLHKKHLLEVYVYNKVYMIWLFQYHTPYQPSTNIIPRAELLGLYWCLRLIRMWYWKSHMLFSMYHTSSLCQIRLSTKILNWLYCRVVISNRN